MKPALLSSPDKDITCQMRCCDKANVDAQGSQIVTLKDCEKLL